MKYTGTDIDGVFVVETDIIGDHRGSFKRVFCEDELRDVVGDRAIVQMNHSVTAKKGALRGLHYQNAPHAEMKLVRCLKGRVFDVAVDLRPDSPTYLRYHAEELSPENAKMLVIPEGCAHGFQALEDDCELLYLHTAAYAQSAEGGARYDDPAIGIDWPLPVTDISERDENHPPLEGVTHAETGT